MENTKICSKCGRELPLSEFYKDRSKKDGLQYKCKQCIKQHSKQWYADNAEHKKQYDKQYRAEHREKMKQLYADNAERLKQYRATIEGYARVIRYHNLQNDRRYGRIEADEDSLPTIDEYIELLQQPDFYDGKQYHWSEMGLDRIDNSKPHTIDNVVPATTEHNRQRQKMSFEEFKAKIALHTSRNSSLF